MILTPDQYASKSVYDLLEAASRGRIGFDHRLIHAIVDRPAAPAVADLVRWGTEDHEDAPIDLEDDLIALARHFRSPETVPLLVHCVKLHPDEVQDELFSTIYAVRNAALEPLLKLYGEVEEDQGAEIAFLLASFRISDPRVLEILLDRLDYDAGDGALSLGMYGDSAARPALEKMLAEVDDPHLKSDIQDALQQLGRTIEENDEPFDIYEEYPKTAGPVFELLNEGERLEMLKSDSAEYRTMALSSFVNRDLSDDARKKIFSLAKSDPEPEVRGAAWEALNGELKQDDIRDAMLAVLKNENAPLLERSGALVGLAAMAPSKDVQPYVEEFYENPSTRAKAMESMWRSLHRGFSNYFAAHVDDPDEDIQRAAIWGIGYLGVTNASEKLVPLFEQEEWRPDALFAYALSARHEISKSRIHGLYRRIEELAGGLTENEIELVKIALDERLVLHGQSPVFFADHEHNHDEEENESAEGPVEKVGRNDPCPCGSGKKYKKCHGAA